jgi:hypothetical protein
MVMPVIRVPDEVFRRLQRIATPLVDTPASVIEKLLDSHESNQGPNATATRSSLNETGDPPTRETTAETNYETYENRNNPHVTIHKVHCSQLRKRGGLHRHGQGKYRAHRDFAEAERYAGSTGLPVKFCKYCTPDQSA